MKRRRVFAALTAALMIGALLSACLVLGVHAGHGWHDGRCAVCTGLQVCAEQFQTPRMSANASAHVTLALSVRREASRAPVSAQSFQTLVTCKVKLSN